MKPIQTLWSGATFAAVNEVLADAPKPIRKDKKGKGVQYVFNGDAALIDLREAADIYIQRLPNTKPNQDKLRAILKDVERNASPYKTDPVEQELCIDERARSRRRR